MAKKIIIDFEDQPITTGAGFGYSITINGFDLFYTNGLSDLNIEYIPFGDEPETLVELAIGANLQDTLEKTVDYLRIAFVSDIVFYSVVDNTIEVFINADATVVINEEINNNISITTEDVEPSGINLIYYLIYGNYRLNIYKENYNGGSSEIFGTITINKSTVDSILEPIRGTGLNISLEANQSLTFDEFLLSDEFTYKTELLKNDYIIYEGYIKPDGVQQSFVADFWYINIESTDGLGALKDLSFVKPNGLQYTGKLSFYEIIEACLKRTRLTLDINTSIALEYNGYTGTNILKDVYLNSSRFIKESNDVIIMDCNEVLTSVLNLLSAVITQQDGQWWIFRPNDLQATGFTEFINQTTDEVFNYNFNAVLGSQINNFYPHHCGANQQIEVKGAISAYRLNYQYGFLGGIVANSTFIHSPEMVFNAWTTNPSLPTDFASIINNPNDGLELSVKELNPVFPLNILTSDPITVFQDDVLNLIIKTSTIKNGGTYDTGRVRFFFKISTSDGYYLNQSNQWSTSNSNIFFEVDSFKNSERFYTNEITLPPIIADSEITILIICPVLFASSFEDVTTTVKYSEIQIIDNQTNNKKIIGEFHTVTRLLPPSSITKENQKVFNGDGDRILIGSIYKDDLTTLTTTWTRKNKFETLPLLGISAMDDLRIQSRPVKIFSGDIFGYMPYLSVIKIDGIVGIFMFTEWSYNLNTNIVSQKLMQFYNDDLADISYEVTPDYGNSTVKPTIKG
jgi:hypothetical protein